MIDGFLRADDLVVGYESRPVLEEIALDVIAGQFTVLIGPNACGKSTLLRSLARLIRPKSGTVLLNGKDIHRMSTRDVARQLAILPQSPICPDGLTVADLVSRGRYPHQSWWRQFSYEDEHAISDAMQRAGVSDLANRLVDSLSGGQRQRAWVAMALAQDTRTLLLDEPTTYLDIAHQIEVLDLLDDLRTHEQRTVLAVLHDLNQACRYADRLIVMCNGRIVAYGPPNDVITAGLVWDTFGLHCLVIDDPVTGTPLVVPSGRRARKERSIKDAVASESEVRVSGAVRA